MKFILEHICSQTGARAGRIVTEHGEIKTPTFMPVATKGSVRGLDWRIVEELGAQIVLANTYHLHLRPGEKEIEEAGGLHEWSQWKKPFLTDSGGFQVFSFAQRKKAKISEKSVIFKDDLSGDLHEIGPRESMQIQKSLGADLVMAFDYCPPAKAGRSEVAQAVKTTFDWAKICMDFPLKEHQRLMLIVQGGRYNDLRQESLEQLVDLDAFGYAIGGVSVGESRAEVDRVVREFAPILPKSKLRYVMGVGTPHDLLSGILAGVDVFDCVLPTRLSRHGSYFDYSGKTRSITQKIFKKDYQSPLVENCQCPTCSRFSRAYLRHLFMRKELTAYYYLAVHNLHVLINLPKLLREAIFKDSTLDFAQKHFSPLI